MTSRQRARRLTYLVHRWTGVGACLLMAPWFVSGVVMLFVGYPKLTPWERMQALAPLDAGACCVPVDAALALGRTRGGAQEVVLSTVGGHARYIVRTQTGAYLGVNAADGTLAPPVDAAAAMRAAREFIPGADARYLGQVQEDRWTRSRGLDAHRPLHEVQMHDDARTLLYVSSTTGQVVMDAPRAQRLWNYVGAWLHWLYMFRDRSVDPVWSWTVIVLSAVCVVTSVTGTVAGIWRWRFSGRYKSGSRSPYRDFQLHWHHVLGLVFASIVFTWIFSGLMSMNPLGVFDAKGARPNVAAYRGGSPQETRLALPVPQALALLQAAHFRANELEWRVLDGRPFVLARNAANDTRLLVQEGGGYHVLAQWPDAELLRAGQRLLSAPMVSHEQLEQYDLHYYGRQPEAMMGAAERRLPVWRVRFGDAQDTWVYLDPRTGDMAVSADRAQRRGRWLFSFLHSWDLPSMLRWARARDAVLILLSVGGLLVSLTGIVIGYRRVRTWLA